MAIGQDDYMGVGMSKHGLSKLQDQGQGQAGRQAVGGQAAGPLPHGCSYTCPPSASHHPPYRMVAVVRVLPVQVIVLLLRR